MTPGGRVLVLGRDHTNGFAYCENAFFLEKSSLLPGIDQTNYVYCNDEIGRVYQN